MSGTVLGQKADFRLVLWGRRDVGVVGGLPWQPLGLDLVVFLDQLARPGFTGDVLVCQLHVGCTGEPKMAKGPHGASLSSSRVAEI